MKIYCALVVALALVHSSQSKTIRDLWNEHDLMDYKVAAAFSTDHGKTPDLGKFLDEISAEIQKFDPDLVTVVNAKLRSLKSEGPDTRSKEDIVKGLQPLLDASNKDEEFEQCLDKLPNPQDNPAIRADELRKFSDLVAKNDVEEIRELRARLGAVYLEIKANADSCLVKLMRAGLCNEEDTATASDTLPEPVIAHHKLITGQLVPRLVEKKFEEVDPATTLAEYQKESELIREAFMRETVPGSDPALTEPAKALAATVNACYEYSLHSIESSRFPVYKDCANLDAEANKAMANLFDEAQESRSLAVFEPCRALLEDVHTDKLKGEYTADQVQAWAKFISDTGVTV